MNMTGKSVVDICQKCDYIYTSVSVWRAYQMLVYAPTFCLISFFWHGRTLHCVLYSNQWENFWNIKPYTILKNMTDALVSILIHTFSIFWRTGRIPGPRHARRQQRFRMRLAEIPHNQHFLLARSGDAEWNWPKYLKSTLSTGSRLIQHRSCLLAAVGTAFCKYTLLFCLFGVHKRIIPDLEAYHLTFMSVYCRLRGVSLDIYSRLSGDLET